MDKKTLTPKKKLMVLAVCVAALLLFLYLSTYLTGSEQPGGSQNEMLAEQMEDALSEMKGVGEVRVVIHYTDEEQLVSAAAPEETVFGDSEPINEVQSSREISGVMIVAEGAEDIRVRTEMMNAVTALLDVAPNRVEILY